MLNLNTLTAIAPSIRGKWLFPPDLPSDQPPMTNSTQPIKLNLLNTETREHTFSQSGRFPPRKEGTSSALHEHVFPNIGLTVCVKVKVSKEKSKILLPESQGVWFSKFLIFPTDSLFRCAISSPSGYPCQWVVSERVSEIAITSPSLQACF